MSKTKNFQLIKWKITNNGKDVNLNTSIYEKYDASFKNAELFAIGYNPSNSANFFNDDDTNLWLRNKIEGKFNRKKTNDEKEERKETKFSYLLMNLFSECCANESDDLLSDCNYRNEICKCLNLNKKKSLLLFFGVKGLEEINRNKCLRRIVKYAFKSKRVVYGVFQIDENKFVHPAARTSKEKLEIRVIKKRQFNKMLNAQKK